MQWPPRALAALARGRALPHLAKVSCVRDLTDLVAVPFVATAFWLRWRSGPARRFERASLR
jgi:hypothetical protein